MTEKKAEKVDDDIGFASILRTSILSLLTILFLTISILIALMGLVRVQKPLNMNYIKLHDVVPYEGELNQNELLKNAKYIAHKKIRGPECIEFSKDGQMYTGLMNGQIVRVNPETDSIQTIVRIGDEANTTLCDDVGELDVYAHPTCGCALGIRFHPNNPDLLYVADAFYGIVKVDVKKGTKKIVIGSNDSRFKDQPLKFVDDLDIEGDTIYFIDSSYDHTTNEAVPEFLEGIARGRLFSYNEKTNQLEYITGNLYFPNGIQLLPNKKEALVNEAPLARILKVQLTGNEKGKKEIFLELPQHGDTIRLTNRNTLLVPFMESWNPILGSWAEYPTVRALISGVINLERYFKFTPKHGLVAEYDLSGKPLKSWHDPTGDKVGCASNAIVHKNKLYIGSYKDEYIAVVDY